MASPHQAAGITGAPELAQAELERRSDEDRRRPAPGSDDYFATLGELRTATSVMLDTLQREIAGVIEFAANGGADADHFGALHGRCKAIETSIAFLAAKMGCADELVGFLDRQHTGG